MNENLKLISNVTDIFTSIFENIPSNIISTLLTNRKTRKITLARDILTGEIRQGDISKISQDVFLNMIYNFLYSVQHGTAKHNLILIARLISDIGKTDEEKSTFETFDEYSKPLANLTKNEIEFLSSEIKKYQTEEKRYYYPIDDNDISQSLASKGFLVMRFGIDSSVNKNEEWKSEKEYDGIDKYDINSDTEISYEFSELTKQLIDKYGMNWENIANMPPSSNNKNTKK